MIGANPFIVPDGSMPFATDSHILMTTSQAVDRGYLTSTSGDKAPVITMIQTGSRAEKFALSVGDTITTVNGTPVTNSTLSAALTPPQHAPGTTHDLLLTIRPAPGTGNTQSSPTKEKTIQYTCTPSEPSTCRLGI